MNATGYNPFIGRDKIPKPRSFADVTFAFNSATLPLMKYAHAKIFIPDEDAV